MNLESLIDNWRQDSRDTANPPLHSDANLARWFSEAEEEAAIRKCLLRSSEDIDLAVGDYEFEVPTEIFEVRTARIVENGQTFWLDPSDRYEQDRLFKDWRDTVGRPTAFIHDDRTLMLNRIVETAATLKMEAYRVPFVPMTEDADEPEIAAIHHRRLYGWVTYRAFSVPDSDFMDTNKSDKGLADFEDYFGPRPKAEHRRDNNANRPHSVKSYP
jgi:hypothetical protein